MSQTQTNPHTSIEKSPSSPHTFRLPVRPMPTPAQIISSLRKSSGNLKDSPTKSPKTTKSKENSCENHENAEKLSEKSDQKPSSSLQKAGKSRGKSKKLYMKTVSFDENEDLATSHRIQRKLTPYNANKTRKLPINLEEKVLRKKLFATKEIQEKKPVTEPKLIEKLRSSCKVSLEKLDKSGKGQEKSNKSSKK